MKPLPLAAATALLLGTLSGCATLGGGDESADTANRLQRENVELRRELTMREVEEQRLRQRIADLEARLGGAPRQPSTSTQSQTSSAAALRTETGAETGAGTEPSGAVDFGGDIDEIEIEPPPIRRREVIAAPDPSSGSSTAPSAVEPSAGQGTEAAARTGSDEALDEAVGGDSPQQLYDQGYSLFHQKRYAEAETVFRRFLDAAPTSELADNALFWIGECRYARGDLVTALEAFGEVVDRYPAGNKVADAMLKAGKTLEQLSRIQDAIETYEEVGRLFPGSAASITAREQLESLR